MDNENPDDLLSYMNAYLPQDNFRVQEIQTLERLFYDERERREQDLLVWRKRALGGLFDCQIKTLQQRGCNENILTFLAYKRDDVVERCHLSPFAQDRIPFIVVIPRPMMSIGGLISMVRHNSTFGYTHLIDEAIVPHGEDREPWVPYVIYDIDLGSSLRDIFPFEATKRIGTEGRHLLNVDEGIALCTHTSLLTKQRINCLGSIYRDDLVGALGITLTTGGPNLAIRPANIYEAGWTTPSYVARG